MTQDLLLSEAPAKSAPCNDAARNQLQQFCNVAKNAEGKALLDVIVQMLEAPAIYVFAELFDMDNVNALKNTPDEKYFKTLWLFAYGTYKKYRGAEQDYLQLTPPMIKKLQHLSIASLAIQNKCIPYTVLMDELAIDNVRRLEDVIIEAIYADMIHGRIFQNERYLEIDYAQGRDVPPGYTAVICETLQNWLDASNAISDCVAEQISSANTEKAKRLNNKDRMEQELTKLKKLVKTNVNTTDIDEAMQIDSQAASTSGNVSAGGSDVRKKPCKAKPPARPTVMMPSTSAAAAAAAAAAATSAAGTTNSSENRTGPAALTTAWFKSLAHSFDKE